MKFPHFSILLCLLLFSVGLKAQVINIEKHRKATDTTGFAGSAGVKGAYFKNVDRILSLKVNSDVQFKTQKDLYLLYGEYDIIQSDETTFNQAALLHFRYNRKFSSFLRWEAFTQVQYNEISKIALRWLVGTGPRFKLLEVEFLKVYLGFIPMYEYELRLTVKDKIARDLRLSNYLSFTLNFNEYLKIISTTYFQSLPYNWTDTRIYSDAKLMIEVNDNLSVEITYLYGWDPYPVKEVPHTLIESAIGLKYKF